jgi:hypothetical protein
VFAIVLNETFMIYVENLNKCMCHFTFISLAWYHLILFWICVICLKMNANMFETIFWLPCAPLMSNVGIQDTNFRRTLSTPMHSNGAPFCWGVKTNPWDKRLAHLLLTLHFNLRRTRIPKSLAKIANKDIHNGLRLKYR